jgi:hypothetical protein
VVPGFLLLRGKAATPLMWIGGRVRPGVTEGSGGGRHDFLQWGESKVTVFEEKRIATSWYSIHGIPRTIG